MTQQISAYKLADLELGKRFPPPTMFRSVASDGSGFTSLSNLL